MATARRRTRVVTGTLVLLLASGCGGGGSDDADAARTPSPSGTSTSSEGGKPPGLSLVAIGDSIPYNSADDCLGCTGFVDRYADAVADATGQTVETTNLSQHTGLTLPDLMTELDGFEDQLSRADIIVIGIAHNSIAMNADQPCGATFDETTYQLSDWSLVDEGCAERSAAESRPLFDELYSKVVAWRVGKPTIFRTINKYNDWIGWQPANLTPAQQERTTLVHDVWNTMLCKVAEAHDVTCADIYHAFNGQDGRKGSGDLLAGDYTHPSDKGNELIANLLVAEGFAPLA
jgi:lysophospholipase L1-like esterase